MSSAESTPKVKFPISIKMVFMISFMLIASTFFVVDQAKRIYSENAVDYIDNDNDGRTAHLAYQTHDYLNLLAGVLTSFTEVQGENLEQARKDFLFDQLFKRNEEIHAVVTWKYGVKQPVSQVYKKGEPALSGALVNIEPTARTWSGEVDIHRLTANGQAFIAVSLPVSQTADKKIESAVVGVVDQSKFLKIYEQSGVGTAYLLDRDGNVLAHPREELATTGANLKNVPIVKAMLTSGTNNGASSFTDNDGKNYLGAYRLVGVAGMGVVSQVLEDVALESSRRVVRRSVEIAGIVLFLAFGIAYFFSISLTKPIKSLVALTYEIARGNFKVKVQPKGHDEITVLTHSFGTMTMGLAERDKLKETFNKFHSKEIAEAILKGEIKLGGNRQEATVFFSDIRSFTSMSEEMEAEQVVEMLNEYMTAMVSEIQRHHGVVDKYVGDAIMAVWGVPVAREGDAWNAVRASIAMRERLAIFNEERKTRGLRPVMIGMGLHTGELIAGNIGSTEKMEYTVIGDTVNTASRIESLTKEFGTDMLISENVYLKVKDKVIVEAVSAEVKGKSKALTAYKVLGYYDEAGKPVHVETPYSSYEAGHSDKVVHKAS